MRDKLAYDWYSLAFAICCCFPLLYNMAYNGNIYCTFFYSINYIQCSYREKI